MAPLFDSNREDNSIRRSPSQASHPRSVASGATQRTDVFSDEFALSREMTPTEPSVRGSASSIRSEHTTSNATENIPAPPTITSSVNESNSAAASSPKESAFAESSSHAPRNSTLSDSHDTDPRRSLSVSSDFNINRSPSPYNGPTAPSQPYAMYPQVTRASSVTSGSTVRPMERPFISQGGPEHPYGMYQNTVPEEDDDDVATSSGMGATFVGAPAVASSFAGGSSSSGNDTGDIVGSDGHVEQLPPYTRYADNVVAKGDMADINRDAPTHEQQSPSLTEASALSPNSSSSEAEINPSPTQEESQEIARKEGLYERSKRRKCCGIPLIILVLLIAVIIVSAAVGGVVGGIVGNRKGADHAKAASAMTTTLWLDADPVETGPATPTCPTGHFMLDFDNIGNIDKCVTDPSLSDVWNCQEKASLGITLLEERDSGQLTIQFDDYSNQPRWFLYGPQPPDFNGTKFNLEPVEDRDNRDYGVAMFFSYLFDKIVILPETDLNPQKYGRRSRLNRRASSGGYLKPGDSPWYCYWNQTVEEFWVFLEQDVNSSTATGSVSAAAAMTSGSSPISGYPRTASPTTPQTTTTSPTVAAQAMYEIGHAAAYPTPADWYGPKQRQRRDASSSSSTDSKPTFAKWIKMVEKRKPFGNVEPYCQQMYVEDSFAIVPKPSGLIVNIEEQEFNDFSQYAAPTGEAGATIGDLESLCICEWRYPF